jgi:cob(I)alamin adenosyltransferase
VPANPLHFVSWKTTVRVVPLSTVGSRLTSSTASWMADLADLPMTESKAKREPMVTLGGRAAAACMATCRTVLRQSRRRRVVVVVAAEDAITSRPHLICCCRRSGKGLVRACVYTYTTYIRI